MAVPLPFRILSGVIPESGNLADLNGFVDFLESNTAINSTRRKKRSLPIDHEDFDNLPSELDSRLDALCSDFIDKFVPISASNEFNKDTPRCHDDWATIGQ